MGTQSAIDAAQAAAIAAGLGASQTWQDMTASRAKGVVYTNTSGKPIYVSVIVSIPVGTSSASIYVDAVYVQAQSYASSGSGGISTIAIVPPGSTYHVEASVGTVYLWSELR